VIVLETSAIVAIRQLEPDADRLRARIAHDDNPIVPASVHVEFALLRKLGPARTAWLREFLVELAITTAPIDHAMAELAAGAAEHYGKGTGHPAQLNFGDCLAYAAAKHLAVPLLYKGDDFTHTDIESALPA
jgi:ribonuclease VapC